MYKTSSKLAFLFCVNILSLTAAYAETFNVSTTPEFREALKTAATNGEDGTYKTTDDGRGTFIYFSNESNSISLLGSNRENVILSGDETHQILNLYSTESALLNLENLTFTNAVNSEPDNGGGIYSSSANINNSIFINNNAQDGGSVYSQRLTDVTNSLFEGNRADQGNGFGLAMLGRFYADGIVVEEDLDKAYELYKTAYYEKGFKKARISVRELQMYMFNKKAHRNS